MKSFPTSPVEARESFAMAGASPQMMTSCGKLRPDDDGERHYVQVALDQGTAPWHAWRKEGIGASDAPAIMGENPSQSPDALLSLKLDLAGMPERTARMELGVRMEPVARQAYCERVGGDFAPACVQSAKFPWMRASLDGLSADGRRVIEIKCGRAAYWRTMTTKRPPRYYYGQLQHILGVTGLPAIEFVCYFPPVQPISITVERDEIYIARLEEAELAFWHRVNAARDPRAA